MVIIFKYPTVWENDIFNKLPGRKVLVMGNHDKKSARWYSEHGFDFVCNMFVLKYGGFDMDAVDESWIGTFGCFLQIAGRR